MPVEQPTEATLRQRVETARQRLSLWRMMKPGVEYEPTDVRDVGDALADSLEEALALAARADMLDENLGRVQAHLQHAVARDDEAERLLVKAAIPLEVLGGEIPYFRQGPLRRKIKALSPELEGSIFETLLEIRAALRSRTDEQADDQALNALFSGEYDHLTAAEFRERFPIPGYSPGSRTDEEQADGRVRQSAEAACAAYRSDHHERDYIERTIAIVRQHQHAENCWPQWANIFADEIERLWAADEMARELREAFRLYVDIVKRHADALPAEGEGAWDRDDSPTVSSLRFLGNLDFGFRHREDWPEFFDALATIRAAFHFGPLRRCICTEDESSGGSATYEDNPACPIHGWAAQASPAPEEQP